MGAGNGIGLQLAGSQGSTSTGGILAGFTLPCSRHRTVPLFFFFKYKLGDVQTATSVRNFAAQLNLTNNPDRSSLVQLYLGSLMWMDLRVLLLLLQSRTKE